MRFYACAGTISVTAIINVSGEVEERYGYDAYGFTNFMNSSWESIDSSAYDWETLYNSYRYDGETGLYLVRNRFFHPTLGIWMNLDPIGYAGGLNLYAYCGNAPVNCTDPLGLGFWSTVGYFAAGVVVGVAVAAVAVVAAPVVAAVAADAIAGLAISGAAGIAEAAGTEAAAVAASDVAANAAALTAPIANTVITAGAGAGALAGAGVAGANTGLAVQQGIQTGNWNQAAFDAGTMLGAGGLVASQVPAGTIAAEAPLGYQSDYNGLVSSGQISQTQSNLNWLGTLPTDASGTAAAGATAAGIVTGVAQSQGVGDGSGGCN